MCTMLTQDKGPQVLMQEGCYGYSKGDHSVPGVNMQDVCILQDGLEVTLPLDTDLRSVFFFIGIFGRKVADLRSVPELDTTKGRLTRANDKEGTKTDGLGERHTAGQASGQTDGWTEHS